MPHATHKRTAPKQDTLERGAVVIAPDPYTDGNRRRPFLIVSDEEYPFHPRGYAGVPLADSGPLRINDAAIETEYESLENEYVNPHAPRQINEWSRTVTVVKDEAMEKIVAKVAEVVGFGENAPDGKRGEIVLAADPYKGYGRRPFLIISNSNYGDGHLALPLTRKAKENTYEIRDSHKAEVREPFEKDDNYVNGWNPTRIDDVGRTLVRLDGDVTRKFAAVALKALGLGN